MAPKDPTLKIRETIPFDDVRWAKVLDVMVSKFKLSFKEADSRVKSFFRRFKSPLNLYWFSNTSLTREDNSVMAALASTYGADIIILTLEKSFRRGSIAFEYNQVVEFEPNLRQFKSGPDQGICHAKVEIRTFGLKLKIVSRRQARLVLTALGLLGVVAYVLSVGLLLYGIAVFLYFIVDPYETTVVATRVPSIGLALLCFLVGAFGVFGRSISNAAKAIVHKVKQTP